MCVHLIISVKQLQTLINNILIIVVMYTKIAHITLYNHYSIKQYFISAHMCSMCTYNNHAVAKLI